MIVAAFSQYFFGFSIFISSLFLILLVLVQRGRGGGLTGALGGPGGQSAFGTKAGDLFTRITIVVAAVWISLCAGAVFFLKDRGLPQTGVMSGRKSANIGSANPADATAPAKNSGMTGSDASQELPNGATPAADSAESTSAATKVQAEVADASGLELNSTTPANSAANAADVDATNANLPAADSSDVVPTGK